MLESSVVYNISEMPIDIAVFEKCAKNLDLILKKVEDPDDNVFCRLYLKSTNGNNSSYIEVTAENGRLDKLSTKGPFNEALLIKMIKQLADYLKEKNGPPFIKINPEDDRAKAIMEKACKDYGLTIADSVPLDWKPSKKTDTPPPLQEDDSKAQLKFSNPANPPLAIKQRVGGPSVD